MAKKDWKIQARIDYETTNCTLAEIAQVYKKSESSVRQASAKGKWSKNKTENCTEITQEIEQKKQELIQTAINEAEPKIKELVDDEIALRRRVLQEMSRLAFSDVRKLFDEHGNLLPVADLDDEMAAVVSSVEFDTHWEGRGDDAIPVTTIKIKQWDKSKNLDMLAKHLGLFVKDEADDKAPVIHIAPAELEKLFKKMEPELKKKTELNKNVADIAEKRQKWGL